MRFSFSTVLIIVAAIVIFIILRRSSSVSIQMPDEHIYTDRPSARTSESVQVTDGWPEGWDGEYKGVEYSVDSYDGATMTVAIPVYEKLKTSVEINARNDRPTVSETFLAGEINSLLNLGANYVDINYNTNWIAAEVPLDLVPFDKKLAEKIVEHLIRIKDLISRNA